MSPQEPPRPARSGERPAPEADRCLVGVAADGEIVFAGPSVPDMLGYERSTFVGSALREFVHPSERGVISDAVSGVATTRRVTHRFRHKTGGYVRVESVIDDELAPEFGGRVLTTRRVDADRTFPEQFRAFLEYGTDIVTVVDAEGIVRYESPSVEEVLGYEQGSLVGQSPLGHVHPDDRDRVTEGFYRALDAEDATGSLEFRYRTAEGDWVWLESRTRALPDDAVTGRLIINSREISDRKRRERRLTDRNERLDRFASIVSHDLRNPLSVIRGSMEMAKRTRHRTRCRRHESSTAIGGNGGGSGHNARRDTNGHRHCHGRRVPRRRRRSRYRSSATRARVRARVYDRARRDGVRTRHRA